MMKKITKFIAVAAAAALCAGCASTSGTKGSTDNVQSSKSVTRERIDWKGAGVGADVPDWVVAATEESFDGLPADMQARLKGKFYITITSERPRSDPNSTKDLKMAQEYAAQQYMLNIARSLNTAVNSEAGNVLSSNEDSQKTMNSFASNARFTGFTRTADSWVLLRVKDSLKQTVTDTYTVVQIYACDQSLWEQQAAEYIRELCAQYDSADMKKVMDKAEELAASIQPTRFRDTQ